MESALSCIVPPDETYVVRSQVLGQLPTYHGMESEHPYTHIRDFQVLCQIIKEGIASNETVCLNLFLFTLKDRAKTWLENLTPLCISTLAELNAMF